MDIELVQEFFEKLKKNNKEEINNFFCFHINMSPIEVMKFMVDNGIDPKYNNKPLKSAIFSSIEAIDKILYLINICGFDINCTDDLLGLAISFNKLETFKFLLDAGCSINDKVINSAIGSNNSIYLEIILQYGVNVSKVANLFWKYYSNDYEFIIEKLLVFSKHDLDLNQSIRQYFSDKTFT